MDQNCVSGLGNIYVNEILLKAELDQPVKLIALKVRRYLKLLKTLKLY